MKRIDGLVIFALCAGSLPAGCAGGGGSAPAPTITPAPAATASASPKTTPSATASPTAGPTTRPSVSPGTAPPASPTPTASPAAGALVSVDTARPGKTISKLVLGANMAVWFNYTQNGVASALKAVGFTATRFPGGSYADAYDWRTSKLCPGGYVDSHATFDSFMQTVAAPASLDVAVTLNYGSNAPTCTAGADPAEGAAWVDYANNQKHYGIKWWTVGNENYGNWETDKHAKANDPTTYANAVTSGFYPMIKAKDPSAMVGAVVEPNWGNPAWDSIVIPHATFDFVELHWYAQAPKQETDSYLLTKAPQNLTKTITTVQNELSQSGKNVPIFLGELGSVYSSPGKQAQSITQALFAGEVVGEMLNAGVARATWWIGFGGCGDETNGNFSPSLYGWQTFGGYEIISDGLPENGCPGAPQVPLGTPLATARAFQVLAHYVRDGEHVLPVAVNGSLPNVRAYATTYNRSVAVLLFNLDQNTAVTVPVGINGVTSGLGADVTTYGKAQYDLSAQNQWVGPTSSTLGPWNGTVNVSLPAWSISAVVLR